MKLTWDGIGQKFYEAGVDHGVLYIPDAAGNYVNGVAWNGLTAVTESPSGAEPNAQYADNVKYLNIRSAEAFGGTIEAYTYPDEFAQFDGLAVPVPGVTIGQQSRKRFGLCYRTLIGNDLDDDLGYKLHLVYGGSAKPSERANATINDSPDGVKLSWEIDTIPIAVNTLVAGRKLKPTSIMTISSIEVAAGALAALELILYGDDAVDPHLPFPDAVIALFAGTVIEVAPPEPAFNAGTNTITIPAVAGVTYNIGGDPVAAGPVVITEDTVVTATPNMGYVLAEGTDDDWFYNYTP